jgi:hypothetical protein
MEILDFDPASLKTKKGNGVRLSRQRFSFPDLTFFLPSGHKIGSSTTILPDFVCGVKLTMYPYTSTSVNGCAGS